MNRRNLILISGLIVTVLTGCRAPDKVAPKDPIIPTELQNFELGSALLGDQNVQTFQNNKVFLWREPLHPNTSELVQRAAKQIDKNEDEGVNARVEMDKVVARLSDATDGLNAAIANLDDATKSAVGDLVQLVDEKVMSLTFAEIDESIAKTESDLVVTNTKLDSLTSGIAADVRDALAAVSRLSMDRARLSQDNPTRDTIQDQLDALNRRIPKNLPAELASTRAARESLLVSYEGLFRDRFRRTELEQLIPEAERALPALTPEVKTKKERLDAIYADKEKLFRRQYKIGKRGETLVNSVISNTDYFENRLQRVTFRFRGAAVEITMVDFPEKAQTMSTANQTIRNVGYRSRGGVMSFEVYPAQLNGDYFRFKLSRTRLDITDGRIFYQGDMDLCLAGGDCEPKHNNLLRHGVAKFATSN